MAVHHAIEPELIKQRLRIAAMKRARQAARQSKGMRP